MKEVQFAQPLWNPKEKVWYEAEWLLKVDGDRLLWGDESQW